MPFVYAKEDTKQEASTWCDCDPSLKQRYDESVGAGEEQEEEGEEHEAEEVEPRHQLVLLHHL